MSSGESKPRSAESRLAWARLWARYIDLTLYAFLIAIAAGLLIPGIATWNRSVVGLALFPPALLVDAVVIGVFGTSIGKFIAGVKVVSGSGTSPDVPTCIRRSLNIYLVFGCGIPIVALPLLIYEYLDLRRSGSTWWDRSAGTRVESAGSTPVRTINAALVYVALVVGAAALAVSR